MLCGLRRQAMAQFRVFISAVSSEFELARDALAADLQSFDDVTVKVQRSFRHDRTAETLLHKLRNYIEQCHAVICLVGARSGAGFPTAVEAAPFLGDLPPGVTEASYTQWEFFFALHFSKVPIVYVAKDAFRRSRRNPAIGDQSQLRALAIVLAFQRNTGHAHPRRDAAIANYRGLLALMGKRAAEIAAELATLPGEAGLELGRMPQRTAGYRVLAKPWHPRPTGCKERPRSG
jgi:hypothetical protein